MLTHWWLVLLAIYLAAELWLRGRLTLTWLTLLVLTPSLLDYAISSLLKRIIGTRYVLEGRCHMCATCCNALVDDPPTWLKGKSAAARLYLKYHRLFHDFELVARGPHDEYIFRCLRLGPDNLCRHYFFRPRLCRDYPLVPFFDSPQCLPQCGFRPVLRKPPQPEKK